MINGSVFTTKSDVYSFGIILWELAMRQPPFSEYPVARSAWMSDFEDEIVKGLRPTLPPIIFSEYFLDFSSKNGATNEYAAIVSQCWDQNSDNRPDFTILSEKLVVLYEEMFTKPPVSSLSPDYITTPVVSSSPTSTPPLSPNTIGSKHTSNTAIPNPPTKVTPSPRRSKSRPKLFDTLTPTASGTRTSAIDIISPRKSSSPKRHFKPFSKPEDKDKTKNDHKTRESK